MIFSRNIGLITEESQNKLENSSVLIAGVGGMGGVAAEVLVRMGVGKIKICDNDHFEDVNFNRQIHSSVKSVGHLKVEILKKEFLDINPNLKIETFSEGVTLQNIDELLMGIDVVINGMDKMYYSLILERHARKQNKIVVDAWLTPFASVFVMTPKDPHWEVFLNLPTKGVPINLITPELCREAVKKEVEYTFSHFDPYSIVDQQLVKDVATEKRPRPSLAPVVWLSGVMMANETFKVLTGIPHVGYRGVFYNQYNHELMTGNLTSVHKIKRAA